MWTICSHLPPCWMLSLPSLWGALRELFLTKALGACLCQLSERAQWPCRKKKLHVCLQCFQLARAELLCLVLPFSPPESCSQRDSFKTDPGLFLSLMAPLYLVQTGKVTSSQFTHWEASLWILELVDLVGKGFPYDVTDALWMAWVEEAISGTWWHWFPIGLYHNLSPNIK